MLSLTPPHHDQITGHPEVGHESVALILDPINELDALFLQLRDGLGQVVTVEGYVVSPGWLAVLTAFVRRVTAHLRFRQVEDQPTVADVGGRETELIS